MNKQNELPQFEARVLEESELALIAGGCPTSGSHSVCCADGIDEGDSPHTQPV